MSREHSGDGAREGDTGGASGGDADDRDGVADDATVSTGEPHASDAEEAASAAVSGVPSAGGSASKRRGRLSGLTSTLRGKRRDEPARTPPAEERLEPPVDDTPAGKVRRAVLDDVIESVAAEETAADEAAAESVEGRVEAGEGLEADELTPPSREFVEERWFDFSYLEDAVEVERHWVNRPYAYVSILYDEAEKTYTYHVVEPELDAFEQYVREDLVRILRNSLMYQALEDDDVDRETVFRERATEIIREHAATVEPGVVHKLIYYLLRDFLGLGQIDALMRDGSIEDVSCDGADVPVYVYHRGYRDLRTNVTFEEKRLNSFVVRLAQRAGKHLSISDPLVDASLPDGSRIQLTLGADISTRGSNFTVRKFADVPYTPIDLVKWNTFSVEQMAYLWLCIENNRSLVFAGGTGSGKTTSMNALGFFVPPDSKVVSIEDTREITLPNQNWIQSVSRSSVSSSGRGEIGMYQLLQAALRQRPEYIIVGEIRTEQRVALTFFQAIATGHTAYTTVHSDSVEGVLARLQNPPLSVPTQMIQELDVVCVQKQILKEDRRVRRNQTVSEIRMPEDGSDDVDVNTVFERNAREDRHEKVRESKVLDDVADIRGWDREEVERALDQRERVLAYLVDNDVTAYDEVAAVIHTFSKDPDYVLERIEADDLDAEALAGGGK